MIAGIMSTAQAQIRPTNIGSGNTRGSGFGTVSNTNTSNNNNGLPNSSFPGDSTKRDSNAIRGIEYHKEIPDSVLRSRVFMFHYVPFTTKIFELWNPTLDPTGIQFPDRLDAFNGNYYLSKGIVGQPHIGLFPTFANGLNDNLTADPHEGYTRRLDNIWLYQTMTPYSRISYNSSTKKDYQVSISHSQNLRPGWNMAFDYDLICPEGNYPSSGVKNHYLDATTNYFSPDSRLQAAAGIIWQRFDISENGGLSDDSYFLQQIITNRAGIPVNLYDSASHNRETAAFARASYNLVQQVDQYHFRDSIVAKKINDTLTVMDTVTVTDTIHVGKPHVINAGVFGAELTHDRRRRRFADSTYWRDQTASLYWSNDAYPDHRWRNPLKLTIGSSISRTTAVFEDNDTLHLKTHFHPFAKVELALGRSTLTLDGMLESDSLKEFNHHAEATLRLPFDSAGHTLLRLTAVTEQQDVDLRMQHYAATELRPQAIERYELQFTSHEWLDLMLRANHLSHNTWYDSNITVVEGSTPLWLFQGALTLRLAAGWLHLDMQQLVQHSTDAVQMPVPLWTSKNSLYVDLFLFSRVMRLQTGIDLRYHTPFYTPAYDHFTGLFYHQNQTQVGGYLWGDVFINIHVKRASIYAKAGHLNALWESSPTYFLLPHYPGRSFALFWGLTWHFFD